MARGRGSIWWGHRLRVKREFKREYLEYWDGTVEKAETGRLMDAFLLPAAPFAAPRRVIFLL